MAEPVGVNYETVTVLIVEDEETTRMLLRGMLRQIGIFSTAEAADGKAGLSEMVRTRPNLVLCDIHMEPMGGREFLKMVRGSKIDWVRTMPVIFLTADAKPETVAMARELKANAYLVKPVDIVALKDRIDKLLKATAAKGRKP